MNSPSRALDMSLAGHQSPNTSREHVMVHVDSPTGGKRTVMVPENVASNRGAMEELVQQLTRESGAASDADDDNGLGAFAEQRAKTAQLVMSGSSASAPASQQQQQPQQPQQMSAAAMIAAMDGYQDIAHELVPSHATFRPIPPPPINIGNMRQFYATNDKIKPIAELITRLKKQEQPGMTRTRAEGEASADSPYVRTIAIAHLHGGLRSGLSARIWDRTAKQTTVVTFATWGPEMEKLVGAVADCPADRLVLVRVIFNTRSIVYNQENPEHANGVFMELLKLLDERVPFVSNALFVKYALEQKAAKVQPVPTVFSFTWAGTVQFACKPSTANSKKYIATVPGEGETSLEVAVWADNELPTPPTAVRVRCGLLGFKLTTWSGESTYEPYLHVGGRFGGVSFVFN
jgi:hypothetical protein